MRSYAQTLEFLYQRLATYHRIGKQAYKANLDNSNALDKHSGFPHKKFKSVHIAGTNGKGSVSHMLASALQEAGYKTGLYTSPHLIDFRERIRINGKMIPENEVIDFVEKSAAIIDSLNPSFFELTTALCFDYFARQQIDIAVIETGLGGRLDSTNIITPVLSVITNIGLDHTDLLGNSIEQIAREKAGIIKPDIPVVIGNSTTESKPVFIASAEECRSGIFFASEEYAITDYRISEDNFSHFSVESSGTILYENIELCLGGKYQKSNCITSLCALDVLRHSGISISDSSILNGLRNVVKNTGFSGRWQIIKKKPLIICDTCHNADGIKEIVSQLASTNYKKLHFVFGTMNDKDHPTILSLLPKEATYYFTKAPLPRAMDENVLQVLAAEFCLSGKTFINVKSAVEAAEKEALQEDLIFIGGSNFIVAEALEKFIRFEK